MRCFLTGTPSVLAYAALDAALDVFDGVDLRIVERKSASLASVFIDALESSRTPLKLLSPTEPNERGAHVAYQHRDAARIIAALRATGVLADHRPPDVLRFGLAPLYLSHADVSRAAARIAQVVALCDAGDDASP